MFKIQVSFLSFQFGDYVGSFVSYLRTRGLEATKLLKNQVFFFLGSGSRWLGIYTCYIDWYILPSGGHYFLPSSPFASQWEKSTGLSFENDACSFALNAMATASKCLIFRGNVLQPVIWAIRRGAWQFDPQCSPPRVALISPYQAFFFLLRVALMVAGMIPILTLVRF